MIRLHALQLAVGRRGGIDAVSQQRKLRAGPEALDVQIGQLRAHLLFHLFAKGLLLRVAHRRLVRNHDGHDGHARLNL